jgi:hypothetical protein
VSTTAPADLAREPGADALDTTLPLRSGALLAGAIALAGHAEVIRAALPTPDPRMGIPPITS